MMQTLRAENSILRCYKIGKKKRMKSMNYLKLLFSLIAWRVLFAVDELHFSILFDQTKEGHARFDNGRSKKATFSVSKELLRGLASADRRIELRARAIEFCEREIYFDENLASNTNKGYTLPCTMSRSIEKTEANTTLTRIDQVLHCAANLIEYVFPNQDACQKTFGDLLHLYTSTTELTSSLISHPLVESYFGAGGRVITYIFAGRRKYLSILVQYLLRDRRRIDDRHHDTTDDKSSRTIGIISKVVLFQNTLNPVDLSYMEMLAANYPDFFELRPVAEDKIDSYCDFWRDMITTERDNEASTIDPMTTSHTASARGRGSILEIGMKMDDDIVYIAEDAMYQMLLAKLKSLRKRPVFMQYLNPVNSSQYRRYNNNNQQQEQEEDEIRDDDTEIDELIHTANIINHPRLSQLHQTLGVFSSRNLINLFMDNNNVNDNSNNNKVNHDRNNKSHDSNKEEEQAAEERSSFELGLLPAINELCFNGDSCGYHTLFSGAHALLQHMAFLSKLEEAMGEEEARQQQRCSGTDRTTAASKPCAVSEEEEEERRRLFGYHQHHQHQQEEGGSNSKRSTTSDILRESYDFNIYDMNAFGNGDRWSINLMMFMKHDMQRKFSYDRCYNINSNWGDYPRSRCIINNPPVNHLMKGASTPEQIARAEEYNKNSGSYDDEGYVSQILPVESHTRAVAVGAAIVAHYSYSTQRIFLDSLTELHAKYCRLAPSIYVD